MIKYVIGNVVEPQDYGLKLIIHVCNDVNGFGAGVALAIAQKWPEAKRSYHNWFKDKDFILGAVQFVNVTSDIIIVNMIAQHGYSQPGKPAVKYDKLQECLKKVACKARELNATIHMPRIGSGLAGGKWENIEPIIIKEMNELDVFIYDLK
jgi:O-acetyl-ADP-ribose deacetylase (regulator of RNase III)